MPARKTALTLEQLLEPLPPVKTIAGARATLCEGLAQRRELLIIIDDDPTGSQTVHGIQIYLAWDAAALEEILAMEASCVFICTNSRSLSTTQTRELHQTLGAALRQQAQRAGRPIRIASRSDSTLRGHFPTELTALSEGLGIRFDGWLIAPAFFDGGRFTINDTQWVVKGEQCLPAHETEFARDTDFGYASGYLPEWIEEKAPGGMPALSIPLQTLRTGGPEAVAAKLMACRNEQLVIVNAACDEDLEVFALGLQIAELCGKQFLYRCAASFVKVRAGIPDQKPLTRRPERRLNGLVVVGSYVRNSSDQLATLLREPNIVGIELDPQQLVGDASPRIVDEAVDRIKLSLQANQSVALFTGRTLYAPEDADFLNNGRRIMEALCQIVERVSSLPGFIIAKGGITSLEVARTGLGVRRAQVLGQVDKGISIWKLGPESRRPGLECIVFPGNVGNGETLSEIFKTLSGGRP